MDSHSVSVAMRWLYVALFGLLAHAVASRVRQYLRLRRFKGPGAWSWWWHSKAVISGAAHQYYGDVTENYGPIARIAPNHLITSSPELWTKINAVRSPYTRASWYYHAARFEPGKDNVFTECDNAKHDARRKKLASGYSGKESVALEPTIDTHIKELVHLIRSKYAAPAPSITPAKPMDLASTIQYLTLDVVSELSLGKPFGDLKADKDVNDYLKASADGLRIGNVAWALGTLWLRDLPIIGPAISPSEKDASGFGRMMGEARKIIDERRAKPTDEKSDILASFIRNGVSGEDLFHEVFEQILAGADTTAGAIRATMLFLMSHPRVYKKLQAEIDEAVKSGAAPPSPDIISDAEARRLPYLAAVVREGMRVHPPAVNIFSRVAPPEGDAVTVDGKEYFIPGGTMVGYSAWSMHKNNTSVYGSDAEVFRPERWLLNENIPEEKERLARMMRVNDLVFGYGRWVCLGKGVAMIEIHKALFELLRNFDFAITNPHKPWDVYNMLGLWDINDMPVNVTERS
ncbi:cytochrome P450 monooxygenase-like protein [Lentithecium fluviatile CBS 122367]|uniref:Cytochrome P450 monooxygenase ABA1 n=1 Tax=Lentithecium fluviatile CBS 122367 TaxID=1168545 RepID=A0A6G1J9M0_9PLEO|nr:cytochrome P450 monooxygenase-like protein [Lentithecium fluviatile CBS 122367]